MVEQKKQICKSCPLNYNNICSPTRSGEAVIDFIYNGRQRYKGQVYSGCSCPLEAKWANPKSQCPIGKFEGLCEEN